MSETERPSAFYVVSDNYGYVTTYTNISMVQHLTNTYPTIPFLVQRFDVSDGPLSPIWVVLYRDIDAVAFVSNNKETAITVQGEYNKIGLSYPDPIDYWQRELGTIEANTKDRLESFSRANTMYTDTTAEDIAMREADDMSKLQRLTEGRIQKIIKENEKMTIFDCVEPVGVGGVATTDAQLETQSAGYNPHSSEPLLDVNGNPIEESPPIVVQPESDYESEPVHGHVQTAQSQSVQSQKDDNTQREHNQSEHDQPEQDETDTIDASYANESSSESKSSLDESLNESGNKSLDDSSDSSTPNSESESESES